MKSTLNKKINEKVNSQLSGLATTAERKYKVFKHDSSAPMQQFLNQIEQQLEESVEMVKDTFDGLQSQLEKTFKQNPAKLVAGAFTAGVIVGVTIARLKNSKD